MQLNVILLADDGFSFKSQWPGCVSKGEYEVRKGSHQWVRDNLVAIVIILISPNFQWTFWVQRPNVTSKRFRFILRQNIPKPRPPNKRFMLFVNTRVVSCYSATGNILLQSWMNLGQRDKSTRVFISVTQREGRQWVNHTGALPECPWPLTCADTQTMWGLHWPWSTHLSLVDITREL